MDKSVRLLWGVAVAVALVVAIASRLADDRETAATPVLVAKQFIPAGTPGDRISGRKMYARTSVPRGQVEDEAIADPGYLGGRVAATDIFLGAQLTAASFRP
jgi:hypothetical protein